VEEIQQPLEEVDLDPKAHYPRRNAVVQPARFRAPLPQYKNAYLQVLEAFQKELLSYASKRPEDLELPTQFEALRNFAPSLN
jgi:hypothetical protein